MITTQQEFLQDAINYYWGRPERRCVDKDDACSYSPQGVSDGCAIGRHLSLELVKKLPNLGVDSDRVFRLLPDWMVALGRPFLRSIQILHDSKAYSFYDKDKERIKVVCDLYGIDFNKITFPK